MSAAAAARAEFVSVLREAFLEVALKGRQAGQIGMSEEQVLLMMAPAIEPVVQTLMRHITPQP